MKNKGTTISFEILRVATDLNEEYIQNIHQTITKLDENLQEEEEMKQFNIDRLLFSMVQGLTKMEAFASILKKDDKNNQLCPPSPVPLELTIQSNSSRRQDSFLVANAGISSPPLEHYIPYSAHSPKLISNIRERQMAIEANLMRPNQSPNMNNSNREILQIYTVPIANQSFSSRVDQIAQEEVVIKKSDSPKGDGPGRSNRFKRLVTANISAKISNSPSNVSRNKVTVITRSQQPDSMREIDSKRKVGIESPRLLLNPNDEEGKKIALVVDDDVLNAELMQDFLERLHFVVEIAYDGEMALELCMKFLVYNKPVSVIFMDYSMPIMDGNICTKKLRESKFDPVLKNTKIIGLTAHKDDEVKRICLESGMDCVEYKPFSFTQTRDILNKFLLLDT